MRTAQYRRRLRQVATTAAILAVAAGNILNASAQTCVQPPAGMVAWYPGDGNALDLQGGDSGNREFAVTFAPGKVAQAFQFDGSSRVVVNDSSALDVTTAITLDAWINPAPGNSFVFIAGKGNFGTFGGQPYSLFFNGGNRTITFRVGNNSTFDALDSGTQIPLNAYTHVAATYDGTTMRIYLDGNPVASKTTTIGALANSAEPLSIGQGYQGAIDELEIFNRVLAQSEIQAIVAADSAGKCKPPIPNPPPSTSCVVAPAGMTAWYPGDGNALDLQGGDSGNREFAVTFAPGKVAQAFQFDGSSRVVVNDSSALDVTTAITLDAWINPAPGNSFVLIAGKGNFGNSADQPYSLFFNGSDRTIVFRVGNNSTFDPLSSFNSIPLNAYTHIAATYDGTRMRLYINGYLEAIKTTTIGTLANSAGPLSIGQGYQGAIDELEIFNRVLAQSEIQAIVAADSAGKCKPPIPNPPPSTSCVVAPAGMTAWYPGDGNTDDIQGGNNGIVSGSGVTFTAGKVAQAFQFNGSGEVLANDAPALDATTALTVDAWINPAPGGNFVFIAGKGNFGSSGDQPYSLFFASDRTIVFRVGNNSTFDALSSFNSIPLNAYTHIAATYDGTRMRLYINGYLDAIKTTTIGTLVNSASPLHIGQGFQGTIDELEIFNVVLPQSEIQRIVGAGSFGKCKCPEIVLSPASLPNAIVGTAYSQTITPSAGAAPFAFSVTLGTLPPGLTLNAATGVISGTPTTTSGSPYAFTISVIDANECRGGRSYSLGVTCPMIALDPSSLPSGTVGAAYNQTVTAGGGTGPYTFAVIAGALPPGLALNSSSGVISGTPSSGSGSPFSFTIRATDVYGCTGTRAYMIAVNCAAITLSPSSLSNGIVGTPYNQTITATGTAGPFTFAITSGGLPTGLSLNASTGQISGTPSAAGAFNFGITATDQTGSCSGSRAYAIAINAVAPPCLRAGTPDITFGGDGFVATSFASEEYPSAGAAGMALQSDGKIVAAGHAQVRDSGGRTIYFALTRYNQDGSLDSSWGTDGRVLTSLGSTFSVAEAAAVLPDGKILAAGWVLPSNSVVAPADPTLVSPQYFALARYNTDGSLDNTFGTNGRVVTDVFGQAHAMAVQSDGKIVLTGYSQSFGFPVVRLLPNGSPDDSFGTNGRVDITFGSEIAEAFAIKIQPDGKLVAGGQLNGTSSINSRFVLVRCGSSGVLDPSFGQGGIVTTDFGPNEATTSEALRGLVIQPDGKIVSAGFAYLEGTHRVALTRHNADGTVDSSFGTFGQVTTAMGQSANALAVAVQPDNKIVVTGDLESGSGIVRYHASGALDSDFGMSGRVIINNGALSHAAALLLQPDGNIVAGGSTSVDGRVDFGLGRVLGAGCPSTNGRIAFATGSGGGDFHISAINPDGSGETSLTAPPNAGDSQPSYSRDGSKIAFSRYQGNTGQVVDIYLMNSDGSNQTRLTSDTVSRDPSLSGDGTKIAFVRAGDIWVMNADGSNQAQLSSGPLVDDEPSFSTDSTRIAFVRSGNIWVMNADGSNPTQRTIDGGGAPAFSPDGSKIAFSRGTGGLADIDIFVMNADGTNATQLTGSYSRYNQSPTFSPDGTMIVYSGARPNDLIKLHLMNADGSDPFTLPTLPSQSVIYPSWGGTAATSIPLGLTNAVSRKMHGGLGPFDIQLPRSGALGVECRNSGGNHTLVFTFTNNLINGSASMTAGVGSIAGSPTFAANTMTVNLTGVTNAQRITLTLSGVTDGFAQVLADTPVSVGFLIGDTNGDRSVNSGDAIATRNRSGQITDAINFRADVNRDGTINSGDAVAVRSASGNGLP